MAADSEAPVVVLVVAPPGTSVEDISRRLRPLACDIRDIGRLGHDLASPLAIIGGMADTLHVAWDRLGEEDRVRLLASIRSQVSRATALVAEGLGATPPPP